MAHTRPTATANNALMARIRPLVNPATRVTRHRVGIARTGACTRMTRSCNRKALKNPLSLYHIHLFDTYFIANKSIPESTETHLHLIRYIPQTIAAIAKAEVG